MRFTKQRAQIIWLIVAVVLLACVCYMLVESGHDCIGESCPVCAQLSLCRNLLRGLGCAACLAAMAQVWMQSVCTAESDVQCPSAGHTLTTLKVKLSD